MVGGGAGFTADIWLTENLACPLPNLTQPLDQPSVSLLLGNVTACFGRSCQQLLDGGWSTGTMTMEEREGHTSATTSSGVLLLGGFYSPNTTELIQSDGQSRLGFSLLPGRSGHCSIEVQKQFPNQSVSTNLISDQSFNPGPHWR